MKPIYLEGLHGIRTAYSEAEAVEHEKQGYKRVDLRKWAKEHDKKRKRRTKEQIEADKKSDSEVKNEHESTVHRQGANSD